MSHTVVVEYVDFPAEVDAVCERCSEIADEISKKLSLLKNNAAETGSRMAQDYIRQLEQALPHPSDGALYFSPSRTSSST